MNPDRPTRAKRKPFWLRLWQRYVMKPANWWIPLVLVLFVGIGSVVFVGTRTYTDAPPRPDFVSAQGKIVFSEQQIIRGQVLFLKHALMDYGSMFGDGALRGPDFTADALHQIALDMRDYYARQAGGGEPAQDMALARTRRELRHNGHDDADNQVILSAGQVYAASALVAHYDRMIRRDMRDILPRAGRMSDEQLRDLTAFFFWGAWVCAAEREDFGYSYTNNWPYDPMAGNLPPHSVMLWSVVSILGLLLALGGVLYLHGRFSVLVGWRSNPGALAPKTLSDLIDYTPTPLQRATYKFFAAAAILFLFQILAGILTVHNFLGLNRLLGVDLSQWLPLTTVRGWHLQLALLWVTACWVGGSIFLVSTLTERAPAGQLRLVNLLFGLFVITVAGSLIGILFGPLLGEYWRVLGNQGWEYVQLGKLWQYILMAVLALWCIVLFRAVQPIWRAHTAWILPKWLVYCVACVVVLFLAGFVARPETNFVIADYWRWVVIHMWVEAFFEVFATILLAYCMYLMGFITSAGAQRIVYLATLLFLGSGLLGISHNFYWNAKPMATLAIGGIFSTLQVVPLILLTLEAWQFRKLPEKVLGARASRGQRATHFGHSAAFAFLLAVNFWNFLGAGVFGFMINLPMVNYYQHGTYLTINHAHAAFMGVYGNLALAAMFFCGRYLIRKEAWNDRLIAVAVISLNTGLFLMCLFDLFPAGIHQLNAAMEHGYWFARSEQFIQGLPFQLMTWARIAGGSVFVLGGVLPIAWFMVSRYRALKGQGSHPGLRPAEQTAV